jgi:hypothetical protein
MTDAQLLTQHAGSSDEELAAMLAAGAPEPLASQLRRVLVLRRLSALGHVVRDEPRAAPAAKSGLRGCGLLIVVILAVAAALFLLGALPR